MKLGRQADPSWLTPRRRYTRSAVKTLIVVPAVPFSAIGEIWLLCLLGYNMSVGVRVGMIALLGLDAETGVFMLLYLDFAYIEVKDAGHLGTLASLRAAIVQGAVKRIRPKFTTVATDFVEFVPILWATGTGSDVRKRNGAPLIGGVLTSSLVELLVYPAIYEVWKWHFELEQGKTSARARSIAIPATPLARAAALKRTEEGL